jgi:hypothetical protein
VPVTTFWDQFERDPRAAENAPLRASDRERDVVHELLGTAYADGRLDREEFDARADQVGASRTLTDLPPIVGDLVSTSSTLSARRPAQLREEAERRYRRERQEALFSFLTPTLICWVIWAWVLLAGHGTPFPWPLFVTLGTGMRWFRMLGNPEDHIVSIQRGLEKRQARELERGPTSDD